MEQQAASIEITQCAEGVVITMRVGMKRASLKVTRDYAHRIAVALMEAASPADDVVLEHGIRL